MKLVYDKNQFKRIIDYTVKPFDFFEESDWDNFTQIFWERLFVYLIGSDGQKPIGALPTRMYESEDLMEITLVHKDGIDTKEYYEDLEIMFGTIWDLNKKELEHVEYFFEKNFFRYCLS